MDSPVKRRPDAGFTLIELMIAITVLALLTTTLTLSLNRPRGGVSADWARFEALYQRTREQAVMSGQLLGVQVSETGYRRLRWSGQGWDELGGVVAWRGAVSVQLPFDQRAPLEFAPSGQGTPVRIEFLDGAGARMCQGDGWSAMTCSAI